MYVWGHGSEGFYLEIAAGMGSSNWRRSWAGAWKYVTLSSSWLSHCCECSRIAVLDDRDRLPGRYGRRSLVIPPLSPAPSRLSSFSRPSWSRWQIGVQAAQAGQSYPQSYFATLINVVAEARACHFRAGSPVKRHRVARRDSESGTSGQLDPRLIGSKQFELHC